MAPVVQHMRRPVQRHVDQRGHTHEPCTRQCGIVAQEPWAQSLCALACACACVCGMRACGSVALHNAKDDCGEFCKMVSRFLDKMVSCATVRSPSTARFRERAATCDIENDTMVYQTRCIELRTLCGHVPVGSSSLATS